MTLADAIALQTAANEQKLSEGIPRIRTLEPDGAIRLQAFERWCREQGVRSAPSHPATVATYIRNQEALGVEPNKIFKSCEAIEALHSDNGFANPIATSVVRAELERVLKAVDAVSAPRSWPRAEQLLWATLPIEIRAIIARRERDRERWVRKTVEELRRQSDGAAKPVTNQKEVESVNQKTE